MSNQNTTLSEQTSDQQPEETTQESTDQLELEAQLEVLQAENKRLRDEYARSHQSQYRKTSIGLIGVGMLAFIGGGLFPDVREVFIAIGATGIFAGILTHFLTPGQFVAASVGERVYTACSRRESAIAEELGLQSESVYVPTERDESAQLFVPLDAAYTIPDEGSGPFILESGKRGLLVETTGAALFEEFERSLSGDFGETPAVLCSQLCDGLVEIFELAGHAEPDIDTADGRITVAISDSAYGAVDRFDHPISSFLAVGLAIGLEQPVTVTVDTGDQRSDWLVTCRFDDDK